MGNTYSQSAQSFLDANPDFGDYVQAEWRSQRAAELDALGGLGRPPLLLGQSFDAKMIFLGSQLQQQGQKMQEIILPQKPSSAKGAPGHTQALRPNRAFFLNTDRRLAIRRGEIVPPDTHAAETLGPQGVRAPLPVQQLDSRKVRDQKGNDSIQKRPSKEAPAEWRVRVHRARRNAFLIVLTMNRLRRGHSHPKRLPFFEDLTFTIPQALGEDCPRFIQEQQRYSALRQAIRAARTELEELLRASADDISAVLPPPAALGADTPQLSPSKHRPHADAAAVAAAAGPGAPVGGVGSGTAAWPPALVPAELLPSAAAGQPAQHAQLSADASEPPGPLAAMPGLAGGAAGGGPGAAKGGPGAVPGSTGMSSLASAAAAAAGRAAAATSAPSPVKRAVVSPGPSRPQALPTVLEAPHSGSGANPVRKPSPASAGYASPSRRPWGVSPNAQLGSMSANARGKRAEPAVIGTQGGGRAGSVSTKARASGDGGAERGSTPPEGAADGPTRAYPKPWRVGSVGGDGDEGVGARAGSARNKLGPLPVSTPPRPPAQRLLQSGTDQALVPSGTGHSAPPKLLQLCSLPPLREASGSSEGSGDDVSAACTPADRTGQGAAKAHARHALQQSPKFRRQMSLDKPAARATTDAARDPCPGTMQQQDHQQQQELQELQQSSVQGEVASPLPAAKAVDRHTRMHELRAFLDQQYELLKKSGKLMGMYVNRVNGGWAEARKWGAPDVASCNDISIWTKGDQFSIYKADVIRQLRLGQIAVQLLVGEDTILVPQAPPAGLHIPHGSKRAPVAASPQPQPGQQLLAQDLWTSDLWELLDQCRPTMRTAIHRLEGLSLGGRALGQMVLSLQALAGEEAVKRLHVLLHVNEDQEEEVVAELHQHKWFGLSPEHVLIVMTQRQPAGLRYSTEDLAFQPDTVPGSTAAWAAGSVGSSIAADHHQQGPRNMGTGHALVQLGWAGHAYTIGPEGLHQPVELPVLELLQSRKVQWMLSRRARDLGLLTKQGVWDMGQLAYAMHLRDHARATAVLEVCFSSSASEARQHDSVIMQQKGGEGGALDACSVSDLRQSELVTPSVIASVEALRTAHGGRGLALGLGRCLYHLPTLKGAMTSLGAFRPRLGLSKDCISVSLDAADMATGHDKARARAVETSCSPGLLTSPASLDALLPLLQAQDHDAAFHDLVMDMVDEGTEQDAPPQARMVTLQEPGQQVTGTPIIVFVARNSVAAAAVNVAANLARGGTDKLILVTFVPTPMQQAEGEELLAMHRKVAFRSMAQVETECVVRGPLGLLDTMERFVEQRSAAHNGRRPLVVMGSVQLTSTLFSYVAGSVTLSFIRRCGGVPVVVVTANSKQVPDKAGMRCLALVEGHSRPMMGHLCKHIIQESRGDRLLLTQVLSTTNLTRQQQANYRRLLESFFQIAHSHQLPVQKALVGDGALDKVLCSVVEEHRVGLLALQLLPGTKAIPQHMLALLRSCRCATLVYSDAPVRSSMLRKSGALRSSMRLLHSELAKIREAVAAEGGAHGKGS